MRVRFERRKFARKSGQGEIHWQSGAGLRKDGRRAKTGRDGTLHFAACMHSVSMRRTHDIHIQGSAKVLTIWRDLT